MLYQSKITSHQAHTHIRSVPKKVILMQNRGCEWCSPFFFLFFRVYVSLSNSYTLKLGIQAYVDAVYCWRLGSYISRYTLYAYYRYVTCSNKKDFQNVSNQDHLLSQRGTRREHKLLSAREWEMIRRTKEEKNWQKSVIKYQFRGWE